MEFAADDMEMEDEIIELEDILEIPEEELGSADLDDAEGKDFASALARNANAVSSVPSAEEDLFPRIASLDDETVGVEDELEHVMLSDEDMQPAGEFEGWTPEFDLMETVCEPKSGPGAGREMDTDAPPAGTSLVLDGLIAQLETKLIMHIQRLLEAKMPGIVASVIGEELENLKKHLRRIENRENDGP